MLSQSYNNNGQQEGRERQIQSTANRSVRYLLHEIGVGKTSLLLKYIHNKFSYDYQVTTGIEFYTKEIPIN